MKKIFLVLTIVILSTISAVAQWEVKVTWNANSANCECETSIGSKFAVSFQVVDNANGNTVICGNSVFVNPTETDYTFDASCVDEYCNEISHENTPSFTVYAYVGFWCAETNPPELICDGTNSVSSVSCYDFSNGTINVPIITLQ